MRDDIKRRNARIITNQVPARAEYERRLTELMNDLAKSASSPVANGICESCKSPAYLELHFNARSPDHNRMLCVRCKDYAERGDEIAETDKWSRGKRWR